jgi:hypothetical protein
VCAYCGRDLASEYEDWLDLSVDHVVPTSAAALGIPGEWLRDRANMVTCCAACNGFLNRFVPAGPFLTTLESFFDLRDECFRAKRRLALERHARERERYARFQTGLAGPR